MTTNKTTEEIKKTEKFTQIDQNGNVKKIIFPHDIQVGLQNNTFPATISGSIHLTREGKSYLVAGSNVTITSASNGQITIASTAEGGGGSGDIAGVTAGNGLTGGGTTGTVTLNVGAGTGIDVNANDVAFDADGGTLTTNNSDVDHILINDGGAFKRIAPGNINISEFNNDSGFTANTGDITGISAGLGLTGGGSSGAVSLGLDFSELTDMTGDISGTTEFILQDGTTESRKAASEIKISNFNNDAGYTTTSGTVTEVTVGTGLDVSSGTTTPNITLDLSELTDMTANVVGTQDELILLDNGAERRKLISEITLSDFNNDIVGGSDTQIQFNNSDDFGGSSAFTFSGTEINLHAAHPAINIRRTNNNQDSDIDFKGAGGVVGARLRFSGSASNDLVMYTFTNSTLKERLRINSNTSDVEVGVTGSLNVSLGLSGSLTRLHDGRSYLAEGSNITITSASNGQVVIASTDTNTMGSGFVLEDGDGTEVTITENKEVKFVEGTGIEINWTDVTPGSDGDPYDLTFTVDVSDFMTNGSNNRIVTATGTDAMNAEANLTFDGDVLLVQNSSSDFPLKTSNGSDPTFISLGANHELRAGVTHGVGTDTRTYISGTVGSINTSQGVTVISGDLLVSGSIYNGSASSQITKLSAAGSSGISIIGSSISVDVSDFMSNGSNNRVVTATGTDAMNAEANLTFDGTILVAKDNSSNFSIFTSHDTDNAAQLPNIISWNNNDSVRIGDTGIGKDIKTLIGVPGTNGGMGGATKNVTVTGGDLVVSGTLKIQANSTAAEYTFPTSDGIANRFLRTDGNGTLSFSRPADYVGVSAYFAFNLDRKINSTSFEEMGAPTYTNGQGYRMPVAGEVTHMSIQFDVTAFTSTDSLTIRLYKNGSYTGKFVNSDNTTGIGDFSGNSSITPEAYNANDTLSLYVAHKSGFMTTDNHVALIRIVEDAS